MPTALQLQAKTIRQLQIHVATCTNVMMIEVNGWRSRQVISTGSRTLVMQSKVDADIIMIQKVFPQTFLQFWFKSIKEHVQIKMGNRISQRWQSVKNRNVKIQPYICQLFIEEVAMSLLLTPDLVLVELKLMQLVK